MNHADNSEANLLQQIRELKEQNTMLRLRYEALLNEKLQFPEQAYQSILDSISEAVYIHDDQGKFVYVNHACELLYGYSGDYFIGKTPESLSAPGLNNIPLVNQAVSAALNGTAQRLEFWGLRKDGACFPKDVHLIPASYLDKKAVIAIASDISERKTAEKELLGANERLTMLIEAIPDAIIFKDGEGRWQITNKAAKEFFKLKDNSWHGKTELELAAERPDFRLIHENCHQGDQATWDTGNLVVFNEQVTEADNQFRYFEIRKVPLFEQNGKRKALVAVGSDITERKLSEKAIIQLSRVVEQSPVSIIICSPDGNIEYINSKTADITGFTRDEWIGMNLRDFCFTEISDDAFGEITDSIRAGKEWKSELQNRKKSGLLYWESILISPIIDDLGQFSYSLVILEDITARKELEGFLITEREKAESANKLKDAFIANISHEIRTPLNGILGMASMIREIFSSNINDEAEHFFSSLKKSSKRLLHSVDMILNYSLMQVGDFPINPVPVSIYSVISKILEDNLRLTNGKRLHIEFRSRVADDMVIADRPAIETVFENIIDNAIKYTEKGSVEITLYRDDQKRLCVSVKDTGVGISGTYLTHLFEPYSQEETGYSRRYEGMGLGLPITKKLLALNDASISVSSKKGEGSLFTVCFANKLPMSLGAKPDTCVSEFSGIATAFPSTGDSMPAILVVEDEKENQFFMDMILKKYFEVVMAADGETALEQFRSRAFDLILMDISLSRGMNGLDLTKIIRAGTKHPDIPIIVVSGHAFPVDRQAALAAGGNDFLVKPFEINELLALVGKYMPEG